jgi:hypothetical protein
MRAPRARKCCRRTPPFRHGYLKPLQTNNGAQETVAAGVWQGAGGGPSGEGMPVPVIGGELVNVVGCRVVSVEGLGRGERLMGGWRTQHRCVYYKE